MGSYKFLKVSSPSPHVAHVELHRTPVNAFNEEFWEEYGAAFDAIGKDSEVRAVVLSSAIPKLFTAGIDVNHLSALKQYHSDPARRALQLQDHILTFQRAIGAPERCPYPVLVAVHGHCVGLGIDIIAACDVRYAASDATFAIKEVDVGLAADIGTLARTPKITGNASLLNELALTARYFSPAEALQVGLVSKVVQGGRDAVVKAALDTAALIASKSPIAVGGTKRLLLHARDHTVQENLEYTSVWNSAMLQTEDMTEAIDAFKNKKTPKFGMVGKL